MEDLEKLKELREAGTLSEEEFIRAKSRLPEASPSVRSTLSVQPDSLGKVARTWITYKVVMGIIGMIIAAIFFFGFFLPQWNKMDRDFQDFPGRSPKGMSPFEVPRGNR